MQRLERFGRAAQVSGSEFLRSLSGRVITGCPVQVSVRRLRAGHRPFSSSHSASVLRWSATSGSMLSVVSARRLQHLTLTVA